MKLLGALMLILNEFNDYAMTCDAVDEHYFKEALERAYMHVSLLKRLNIDNLSTYHLHVLALAEAAKYHLELREDIHKEIGESESQEWRDAQARYISQTKDALRAIGFKSCYDSPECKAEIMDMSQAHDAVCTVFENIIIEMTLHQKEIKQEGAEILAQGCAETQNLLTTRYYKDVITMFDSALLVKAYLTDHH